MNSRYYWLAGTGAALSLVTCYGTLAAVAALGALGIAVVVNETVWAGAIVAFAALAAIGLGPGIRMHRSFFPLLLGVVGVITLATTMYVFYNPVVEFLAFAFLFAAVIWDMKLRRLR